MMVVRVRFGFVRVIMIVVVMIVIVARLRVRVVRGVLVLVPGLWVGELHAESLGPRLHLDKANFSLTASTDKRN
jgi:hypothetical protein